MNHKFEVQWSNSGRISSKIIKGVSDLSEFVRNCDAYERQIISITPAEELS